MHQVVAGSIQWFCPVLGPSHQARPLPRALASYPATSKPPPSTTSPPPSTGFTPSKTGGAHGPVTAPRPQNVPHLSTWWPPLTPDSPLEGVKVFVVVSGPYSRPGHMPDVGAYVSLLCWHMRWHAALGVHQYLMYVQELATPLAQDPRVQRLVQEGALRLLLWDDTPMRDKGGGWGGVRAGCLWRCWRDHTSAIPTAVGRCNCGCVVCLFFSLCVCVWRVSANRHTSVPQSAGNSHHT